MICCNCEHTVESQDPIVCLECANAWRDAENKRSEAAEAKLAEAERERRRWYLADGTFEELDPDEVIRRRKAAALDLAALREKVRRAHEALGFAISAIKIWTDACERMIGAALDDLARAGEDKP